MKLLNTILAAVVALTMSALAAVAADYASYPENGVRIFEKSSGENLEPFLEELRSAKQANETHLSALVLGVRAYQYAKAAGYLELINYELPDGLSSEESEKERMKQYATTFVKFNLKPSQLAGGKAVAIDFFVRKGQGKVGWRLPVHLTKVQYEQKTAALRLRDLERDLRKQIASGQSDRGEFARLSAELEKQASVLGDVSAENAKTLQAVSDLQDQLVQRDTDIEALSTKLEVLTSARTDFEAAFDDQLTGMDDRMDGFQLNLDEAFHNIEMLTDQVDGAQAAADKANAGVATNAADIVTMDKIVNGENGVLARLKAVEVKVSDNSVAINGDGTDGNQGLQSNLNDLSAQVGESTGWTWREYAAATLVALASLMVLITIAFKVFATKKGVREAVAEVGETTDAVSELITATAGWSSSNMSVADLMLRNEADDPAVWKATMSGGEYALGIFRKDGAPNRLFTDLPGCPGYGAKNFEVKALNALRKAVAAGEVKPVATATSAAA